MKWGEFYKAGGAAGFSPQDVKGMSLWEFLMCMEGFKMAQGVEETTKPPSEDEFEAIVSRLADQPMDWDRVP